MLFGVVVMFDGEFMFGFVVGVGEGDCLEMCVRWFVDIGAEAFLLTLGTSTSRVW